MHTVGGKGWLDADIHRAEVLDKKVRSLLTKNKCRFKSSSTDRLYLEREVGGCGLESLADCLQESIVATWSYLVTKEKLRNQQYMFEREAKRDKRTPVSDAERILKKYSIQVEIFPDERRVRVDNIDFNEPTPLFRFIRNKMRQKESKERTRKWLACSTAGAFARGEGNIDIGLSSLWMKRAFLSSQ